MPIVVFVFRRKGKIFSGGRVMSIVTRHLLRISVLVAGLTVFSPFTKAATIFDSGVPAAACCVFGPSTQNFAEAAKITLGADYTISSFESYFSSRGMTATAAVYSDGGTVPTGDPLFQATFDITGGFDWYGPTGLDWALGSGTYWFGFFEPTGLETSAVIGSNPPLPPEATACGTVTNASVNWTTSSAVCGGVLIPSGIALRVSGSEVSVSPVPIPAAGWLFGSILIGFLGFIARVKAV